MTTPWDIYAQQLFPVGYGYPLWMPEPYTREIDIGDVGWIKEGAIHPLFNSMKPEDDPINTEMGVPPAFTVFNPHNVSIGLQDKIRQPVVCSRGIRIVEALENPDSGASFRFQSTTGSGAFVMLEPPGRSKDIESRRHVVNYMREHFDGWLEWANSSDSWGLDLRAGDLIFVCGTMKTTRWAVAAFQGSHFRKKHGLVSGDFGPHATAALSINISNEVLPGNCYRTGPARTDGPPGNPAPGAPQNGQNQCLFVHYYKMKRKFLSRTSMPMQAAGGPHQLPPGPKNPGGEPMEVDGPISYGFEQDELSGRGETCDPVNHLLDYILQHSEADYAIASDLDLISVFTGDEFPSFSEIPEALRRLSPAIEVDERGVGTIDLQPDRKRRSEPPQEAHEAGYAQKRPRWMEGHAADHHSYPMMQDLETPMQPGMYQDDPYAACGIGMASYGGEEMQIAPEYLSFSSSGRVPRSSRDMYPPRSPRGMSGVPHGKPKGRKGYPPHGMPHPSQLMPCSSRTIPYSQSTSASPQDCAHHPPFQPPPMAPTPSHMPFEPGPPDSPPSSDELMNVNDGDSDAAGGDDGNDNNEDEDDESHRRKAAMGEGGAHDGAVTALAYSADGRYLASGSEDTSIIVWDVLHGATMHKVHGLDDAVSALAFSRDGRTLASATHGDALAIWSVGTGQEVWRVEPGQPVHSLAYTPDGAYLVGGAADGTLHLWGAADYVELIVLARHESVATFIVFSPDGRLMATGGTDGECCVWDTARFAEGDPARVLKGHTGMVCAAAFAPDGKRIVTASDDGASRIWNAETGAEEVVLCRHGGPVWTVVFSPDGRRVASGSSDSTVLVCDAASGEQVLALEGHDSMVNAVEFSPDGRYIASASSDNTVRLWSAADGEYLRKYNEHDDNVTAVVFTADGRSLVSCSHDGTVLIRPVQG